MIKSLNSSYLFLVIVIILVKVDVLYSQDLKNLKKGEPFNLSGNLTLGTGVNLSSAPNNPYNHTSYSLNFSPVIKIYNITLPFTFYYTNSSRGFNHPFNQMGVSPTWKWLKLHIGYRSINVSPYVLSGKIILGGGMEMTPGKFRFSFLGGRMAKSQREDTLNTQYLPVTYERLGYGGKIGVGSSRAYFDLLCFKGKDVIGSISDPVKSDVKPSENVVTGVSFSVPFSKRIVWQTTTGISVYTRDLTAHDYDTSLNYNFIDNGVINLNMSSQYLTAGESSIRYSGNKGGFTLKYKRIDPDYKSMGTYYLQTDISEYSVLLNKSLLDGKITLNGNFSNSEDNIYHVRNTLTHRTNGGVLVGFNTKKKLKLDLNVFLFHMYQSYLFLDAGDSLKLDQLNKMISTGIHYTIDRQKVVDVISLSVGYNGFSNLNPNYIYDFSSKNMNYNASYKTLIKKNKSNLTENIAVYTNEYGKNLTTSFSVGESYGRTFIKDKLNTNLSVNFISSTVNKSIHRNGINCQFGLNYKRDKNNLFGLNGSIQNNTTMGNKSIWLSSFNVKYTYSFNQISSDNKNKK